MKNLIKNIYFGIFLLISGYFGIPNSNYGQSIIAKFSNENITVDDLKSAYLKNQNKNYILKRDSTSIIDFLKLYVNYKMKLKDAKDRGFDTDESIKKEIENYKKEVGVPFYLKKYIKEPAAKKLYEMSKFEYRVSHILIKPQLMSDKNAEKLAWKIIEKINRGADFAKLAEEYSADKYSANSGGDIYWVTAGQTMKEFEKAIYETEPGHIYPHPVKTKFGFHIIKVVDKQQRVPGIKISHILIDYKNNRGKIDTAAALIKAKKIMTKLKTGRNFGEIAMMYSEDKGSAIKRGSLGIVRRRMMVKPFDDAAFKLKVGEISGIIRTKYGFHIIKKFEEEKFPDYEQVKNQFEQIYEKRDFQNDLNNILEQLKAEVNYFKIDTVDKIIAKNDEVVKFGDHYWGSGVNKKLKNLAVCSINGEKIFADDVFKSVDNLPNISGFEINTNNYNKAYAMFEKNILLYQKVKTLEKIDGEFRQILDDFKNGIYVFRLQDREVWKKLKIDSSKLKNLYEQNASKFKWKNRVSFIELYRNKLDSINAYNDSIKFGADFAKLAAKHTLRDKRTIKSGIYKLVPVESSEMAARAFTMNENDISKPFKVGRGWSIIKLIEKNPSHQKSFFEAMPEVENLYQEQRQKILENQYIEKLISKYHPKIFISKLNEIYQN